MNDVTIAAGALLGFFVGCLMIRRHIPCGALTWEDRKVPPPASYEIHAWHPVRGKVVAMWRVRNCVDDAEIAEQMIWRSARCLELEMEKREREARNG